MQPRRRIRPLTRPTSTSIARGVRLAQPAESTSARRTYFSRERVLSFAGRRTPPQQQFGLIRRITKTPMEHFEGTNRKLSYEKGKARRTMKRLSVVVLVTLAL